MLFNSYTFLFGFLPLWVAMIVLGTFLRGPNWNFFSPYEFWDVHKLELLNNVNLSELFWIKGLGQPLPVGACDADGRRFGRFHACHLQSKFRAEQARPILRSSGHIAISVHP